MREIGFSVLFPIPEKLSYPVQKLKKMFNSLLNQNTLPDSIYILNQQSDDDNSNFLFELAEKEGVVCEIIPANKQFLSASAHTLAKIKTPYFVFIQTDSAPVYLQKNALDLYCWAINRNPDAGLFYSDYDLIEPEGQKKEVHLLQFHSGRVRDNMDFGKVFVIKCEADKKVGGFSFQYENGYLYDLRLKISAEHKLVLISNRYQGVPYLVEDLGKGHNVFDYLLSSKKIQLEMENILNDHLRRTGAYLAPGVYQKKVQYSQEENEQFKDCIASIIIPVNNRPQFIGSAIESVLSQTNNKVEVIVAVNGGDHDPTIKAVKTFQPGGDNFNPNLPPVRLIVLDINNIGLCLNEGLKAAKGKFYVQLDSDDRLKPNAVEKLLAVFDSDPHIGMVIGSYEVWEQEKDGRLSHCEDIPVVTHDEWTEENGRNNLLRINGAGAPRAAHIKVLKEKGWFGVNDSPFSRNYGEDYEMVLKVSENYRIGRVWDPIYEVVRHSGGTDHSIDQVTIDRNDDAKDHMRLETIRRRQKLNRG